MNLVIPTNRKRFPALLVLSLLMAIGFTINLIYTKTEGMYMNGLFNWIFNSIILLVVLIYLGLSLADFIKTKFDRNASLEINDEGLNDRLSIFSVGKIPWSAITGVIVRRTLKIDVLVMQTTDNKFWIAKKNFFLRYFLKRYNKKWGSPIVIAGTRVDYSIEEIKNIILEHINR